MKPIFIRWIPSYLALIAAVTGQLQMSFGQPPAPSPGVVVEDARQWEWTQEQWTGDNAPYATIRKSIDTAIAAGQNASIIVSRYAPEAQRSPSNAKVQFRWAYATYRAYVAEKISKAGLASLESSRKLYSAITALQNARSPRSYDYTRLRFLMSVEHFPDRHLKDLGRRLLRRDPNDDSVKHRLLFVLERYPGSLEERHEAVALAQSLLKRQPSKVSYHATLAGAYMLLWEGTKSPSDADKAIANYRKYLQLAPPNATFRKRAQMWIDYIQEKAR